MRRGVVLFAVGVVVGVVALPEAALAQQPSQGRTLTAVGGSSSEVTPTDRRNNLSIQSAIRAARIAGVAPALAAARARAELLAQAAGVTLGPIQSVDESSPGGPGYFGGQSELGTFGPGLYCGTVPRFVARRVPGRRTQRVRRGTRRICRFPNTIETRIAVTYAIQ